MAKWIFIQRHARIIVLGLVVWSSMAVLARYFPAVNTDEIFIASHGVHALEGQGMRYGLYDDIFASSVYDYRDLFVQPVEILTNLWVGLWSSASSLGYWTARLSSTSAAVMALCLFYALGCRLKNRTLGLWMAGLLLFDPLFWVAGSVVRAEALLLLGSVLVSYLIVTLPNTWRWKPFVLGMGSGFLVCIHPNALAVIPGLIVMGVHFAGPSRARFAVEMLGGVIFAGFLISLWVGWVPLWLMRYNMTLHMHPPPLGQWPPSFPAIFNSLVEKLHMTQTYFMPSDTGTLWPNVLRLRLLITAVALGGLLWNIQRKRSDATSYGMPFVHGLAITWLGLGFLVSNQEVLYMLNYMSFVIPLLAAFFYTPFPNVAVWRTVKSLLGVLGIVGMCGFVQIVRTQHQAIVPFHDIQKQLATYVPERHLKIAGPNIFWYGWDRDKFRDIGAIKYSRWYTGGSQDMAGWLSRWKPDVIILDSPTIQQFGPQNFPATVTYLGDIDTGRASLGAFQVYRLVWRSPSEEKS